MIILVIIVKLMIFLGFIEGLLNDKKLIKNLLN